MSENQTDTYLPEGSSVLITGGSGLVGRYLTSALLSKGYRVNHLSRKDGQFDKVKVFRWYPEQKIIDPQILKGVDYLIHLAGANIGEKRWTKKRKKEILNSRVDSCRLLYKVVSENNIRLKAFISASAIGYYGSVTSDIIFGEEDLPSTDFLGTICRSWEEAADQFGKIGIRTVKIRTAVVLDKNDSALSKLLEPGKFGFLLQSGNGHQYMPWIHLSDLCNIYLKAITDHDMTGAFNAVSPQHVTSKEFMRILAHVVKLPVFPIPVPVQVLNIAFGEMSQIILKGSRISSRKIENSGFRFRFSNLKEALENAIYG